MQVKGHTSTFVKTNLGIVDGEKLEAPNGPKYDA